MVEKQSVLNRLSGAVRRAEVLGDQGLKDQALGLQEEIRTRRSWEGTVPRVEALLSKLWKAEAGITNTVDPIQEAFDKANAKLKKLREEVVHDKDLILKEALGRDPSFFGVTRPAVTKTVVDPGKYARQFVRVRGQWVQK
ncbi:MAG: hypothetical protein ABID84_03975 [Chloroflexota bacterium]